MRVADLIDGVVVAPTDQCHEMVQEMVFALLYARSQYASDVLGEVTDYKATFRLVVELCDSALAVVAKQVEDATPTLTTSNTTPGDNQ